MSAPQQMRVHFVVPAGLDDPARVSGGNVFDRRLSGGLTAIGWDVRRREVEVGSAPGLRLALADVPARGLVLIDGLVANRAGVVVEEFGERLRIVVLAHMVSASFPGADPRTTGDEQRTLRAARSVIVTSHWTRSELVRLQLVPADRIVVATPGADGATASTGSPGGGELLCVGVVAAHKGQDILVEALAPLRVHGGWRCTFVGSSTTDADFAQRVATRAVELGVADRITMAGVLVGAELDAAYREADLLVAPSRVESYGMAIADALGRGIPVVASRVGGIPRTVAPGDAAMLVPPDAASLSVALERWMVDPALRRRLKDAAVRTRAGLPRWADTVGGVAAALDGVR